MCEVASVAGMAIDGLAIHTQLVPVQAEGSCAVVKKLLCRQAGVKLATEVLLMTGLATGGEAHVPMQPFFLGDLIVDISMAGDTFLSH